MTTQERINRINKHGSEIASSKESSDAYLIKLGVLDSDLNILPPYDKFVLRIRTSEELKENRCSAYEYLIP